MPVLTKIKGIIIRMFFKDHSPPHVHAVNNDKNGLFNIETTKMFKGNLTIKDQKEVEAWILQHKIFSLDMWNTQKIKKLD